MMSFVSPLLVDILVVPTPPLPIRYLCLRHVEFGSTGAITKQSNSSANNGPPKRQRSAQ